MGPPSCASSCSCLARASSGVTRTAHAVLAACVEVVVGGHLCSRPMRRAVEHAWCRARVSPPLYVAARGHVERRARLACIGILASPGLYALLVPYAPSCAVQSIQQHTCLRLPAVQTAVLQAQVAAAPALALQHSAEQRLAARTTAFTPLSLQTQLHSHRRVTGHR